MRPVVKALASGRVVYDGSKIDTCLADAKKGFCDRNSIAGGSCADVFRGTVGPGDTCYSPYFVLLSGGSFLNECDGGYCTADSKTCPGACKAYAPVGADCTQNAARCVSGAYCDGTHRRTNLSTGATCNDTTLRCDGTLVKNVRLT